MAFEPKSGDHDVPGASIHQSGAVKVRLSQTVSSEDRKLRSLFELLSFGCKPWLGSQA